MLQSAVLVQAAYNSPSRLGAQWSLGGPSFRSCVGFLGPASKAFHYGLLLHLVDELQYCKNVASCCALAEEGQTEATLRIPWYRGSTVLPDLVSRTEEGLMPGTCSILSTSTPPLFPVKTFSYSRRCAGEGERGGGI